MTKKAPKHLEIEIESVMWQRVKGLELRLQEAASLTLACLPENLLPAAKGAQMSLLLTTDKKVQTLNRDFRGKDCTTNVLSFPGFERRDLIKMSKSEDEIYVGDIAVAYQFTAKEAKTEHKELLDHVTHLMIHGILHLFGFDHDTPRKAAIMEKLEKEIMATLGLGDPYAPYPMDD